MQKETETEETIVFFVTFLSLVAFQLGVPGPLATPMHSIYDIPRYCSVRQYQVVANVDTFDALVIKLLFRFMNRCHNVLSQSTNVFVHSLFQSCTFLRSKYVARFIDLLTVNGLGEAYCSFLAL